MMKQHKYFTMHRCVHCLTPNVAMYRRLRSSGGDSDTKDIQLLSCVSCASSCIDPYCEREILLVLLDIVLLRIYAYRHLLYNRYLLDIELSEQSTVITNLKQNRIHFIAQLFCFSVLLRSHISIIATEHHHVNDEVEDIVGANNNKNIAVNGIIIMEWIQQFTLSILILTLHIVLASICIFGVYYFMYRNRTIPNSIQASHGNHDHHRIILNNYQELFVHICDVCCIAILYPCSIVYTCTSIVHIWENSATIRIIGFYILLPMYQMIFIYQILSSLSKPYVHVSSPIHSLK